jgi:hypothetical protein
MRLVSHLLAILAFCAAAGACAEHIKGADRQLDRYSSLVRQLHDGPLPANWDEIEVLATVMAYAHDTDTAAGLARLVEREALLEVLGEPLPPRASKVSLAVYDMARARKAIEALRQRALESPLRAQVILDERPAPSGLVSGYRHEGGSAWNNGSAHHGRVLGVTLTNTGTRRILRGRFELELGHARDALRFQCGYAEPLEPGATKDTTCSGNGSVPFAKVDQALRFVASGFPPWARHDEVVYELRGKPFSVKPDESRFVNQHMEHEHRAMVMIQQHGCKARGACGASVKEELESPFLLGLVLGIAAGAVLMLLEAGFGSRAAGAATKVIAAAVFFLMVGGVLAAFLFGAKNHWVYALLFAGAAAGHIGDLVMGGLLGLVGVIAFVVAVGHVRGRLRGA